MSHRSPHDKRLNERLRELERNPFCDPVRADHTDRYPDPEPVNGRIPDYIAECAFGPNIIGEVEKRGNNSRHTQNQFEAFGSAAAESSMVDFEVTWVEDEEDSGGLLDWL